MTWKSAFEWPGERLLFMAVTAIAVWLIQDARWERKIAEAIPDTVVVVDHIPLPPPPVVVNPNPAPAKPIHDPTLKARIDSLISANSNKDSLILALATPKQTQQRFMATDPTGLDVSGILAVTHYPLAGEFWTEVTLDSLNFPVKIVTITNTVIEEQVDWKLMSAIGAGLLYIGYCLGQAQ